METHHAVYSLARLCHVRAVCCIVSVWWQFNWPCLNSVCLTRKLYYNIKISDIFSWTVFRSNPFVNLISCSSAVILCWCSIFRFASFFYIIFCSYVIQFNCTKSKELTWHGCNLWVLLWGHLYIDLSCYDCTDLIL